MTSRSSKSEVVGRRGAKLTGSPTIRSWVDDVRSASGVLVLEGPPGIGKTHLWRELIDAAQGVEGRVLVAQPAQAEARLVGSALIDLCEGVSDEAIAELPDVQADALATALLRSASTVTASPQAVALAFTTLLRVLASSGPLYVCIDDVQWLDAQTAAVLAFAARRLPAEGVGLLLTLRTEPGVSAPGLLADLGSVLALQRQPVPPMSDAELEEVVRARLGGGLTRAVLRAAVAASAGNPLFGIEVAREMVGRREAAGSEVVPMPDSLTALVGRHLTELPAPARLLLAAASALVKPSLGELRKLGMADSLDAVERAGLIRVDGHAVSFTHPLYAAAAYDGLGTNERMDLHRQLAKVVEGQEERARHLALGAEAPDEAVATALDVARDRALRRGAVDAAVDAGRLGVQATPVGSPAMADRRTQLGRLLFRVGEVDRALEELTAAVEQATESGTKALAVHELARVVSDAVNETGLGRTATELEQEALSLVGDDVELKAEIYMGLAISNYGNWDVGVEYGRMAISLLESLPEPNPHRLAEAMCALAGPLWYTGRGVDLDWLRSAIPMQQDDFSTPISDRAVSVLFWLQLGLDEFAAAREQMALVRQMCEDEGDEASRCYLLWCHSQIEYRAGQWAESERLIKECSELSETLKIPHYISTMRLFAGILAAGRGDTKTAIAVADADIAESLENSIAGLERNGRGLRGFCALADGDFPTAVVNLARYMELLQLNRSVEPAIAQFAADHVEALVGVGRLDDAEAALAAMVEPAIPLNRTAVLAAGARSEALLLAQRGDQEAALAAATRSVELYDQIERRFDRARAVLVKGQVHRRFKQKSLARRELTSALEQFEAVGAKGFAEKARSELQRIGLRPPASEGLTATERQIAELTATGLTSAEIGQKLFLTTKTVSGNLTRIYRKLGIRNRAELAAGIAALDDPGHHR